MKSIIDRYLDRVLTYANKPEAEAMTIRHELKDHLEAKIDDLAQSGWAREEVMLEALRRHGAPKTIGYGLRGSFPWLDVRSQGTARGVIAIGPRAIGIFAFGGLAVGVVSVGGLSVGLFSAGGLALGLLFAWGGLGIGGVVCGGLALGIIATGGLALGLVAEGGLAAAAWVPHVERNAVGISHYSSQTVPYFLRAFEPLLNAALSFDRNIWFIVPFYLLLILVFNLVRYREWKRVRMGDDWLLDGENGS